MIKISRNAERIFSKYSNAIRGKSIYFEALTESWEDKDLEWIMKNFERLSLKEIVFKNTLSDSPATRITVKNGKISSEDYTERIRHLSFDFIAIMSCVGTSDSSSWVKTLLANKKPFILSVGRFACNTPSIFRRVKEKKIRIDGHILSIKRNIITNAEADIPIGYLPLTHEYAGNEKQYPKLDNYNAIVVGNISKIPKDYTGLMHVPFTFLCSWNYDQFDVIDISTNIIDEITGRAPKLNRRAVKGVLIKRK